MKAAIYVLSALVFVLLGVAAVLWLSPPLDDAGAGREVRYGLYEGRELVQVIDGEGNARYAVEDSHGNRLFDIPVTGCLLDVRFREGRLRFREGDTKRTGYIDLEGNVQWLADSSRSDHGQLVREPAEVSVIVPDKEKPRAEVPVASREDGLSYRLDDASLRRLKADHPFYKEAARILSGKLPVDDSERRRVILNYCEHFRMAYTTKDIDFLRQVFSEEALIIVGNVVKTAPQGGSGMVADKRVEYYLRTKKDYLDRLSRAFAANKKIDVEFSNFRIMRHPSVNGIYGVSLRQRYRSDRYSDDGWLFLLWDFRNASMPLIHVRTWQPSAAVEEAEDVVGISDFNLQ